VSAFIGPGCQDVPIVSATEADDPWSAEGFPTRSLPVWLGMATGGALGLVWLAAGRPVTHASTWLPILLLLASGGSAFQARHRRRFHSFWFVFLLGWIVLGSFGVVARGGVLLVDDSGTSVGRWLWGMLVTALVAAALLLGVKQRSPSRRLPEEILAQIKPPTMWRNRKVRVRCRDGSERKIYVLPGGFIFGRTRVPIEPSEVVSVVGD